jgi:hypothetical protein
LAKTPHLMRLSVQVKHGVFDESRPLPLPSLRHVSVLRRVTPQVVAVLRFTGLDGLDAVFECGSEYALSEEREHGSEEARRLRFLPSRTLTKSTSVVPSELRVSV